ncbi:hypothetical protein E8E11_001220 [Didymella keratinophila]|nr:hypothetical protein E8E11_001220 [Didymella keratinophila]
MVRYSEEKYHAGTVDFVLFLVDVNMLILRENGFTKRHGLTAQAAREPQVQDIINHIILWIAELRKDAEDMISAGTDTALQDKRDQQDSEVTDQDWQRRQEAERRERTRRMQAAAAQKRKIRLRVFLEEINKSLMLVFGVIRACANGELSSAVMAMLVNFAILRLEVMSNTFVAKHLEGDDAQFLNALQMLWEQKAAAIEDSDNTSANEKKVKTYEEASNCFLPATAKFGDLRLGRIDLTQMPGRSGLIHYQDPIPFGSARSTDRIRLKSSESVDEKHYLYH